jgi:two-component system, OmpR family, sensor histidine kinase KdpD
MKIELYDTRKSSIKTQILLSVFFIMFISLSCFLSKEILGYKTVAMILLMTVSILAMLFDIIPVLIASILGALTWNYFFIPPIFTFHISNAEDLLMFILYFVIALVNAVLTFQIRKEEKKTRDKEEKENTIKLYDTLLNSLSHELRTPIATIISSVDSLKEIPNTLSIESKNEILNQIDIATVRLNRQVENLLNMSRLESGTLKPNLEWTDVNDLIFSTMQKLNHYSQNHIVNYEYNSQLPLCKIDEGMIEQVIYNILFNAMHYTPKHSKIDLATHLENQVLEISIQDNGNGIPNELIGAIFEKFYRLPNTKTGGTGLGLSIAEGFVEAHNGKINAKNTLPQGLRFFIEIPVEVSYINSLKNE